MYTPEPIGSQILLAGLRIPGLVVVGLAVGVMLLWPGANIGNEKLPNSVVTITFDDGYQSVYENALPILKEHDYPATVYPIAGYINQGPYMGVPELKALEKAGWEIGSHTVTHPHLTELSKERVKSEVRNSKLILEELGFEVQGIVTPYGDCNKQVLKVIKEYYTYHRAAYPNELNNVPLEEGERYELKPILIKSDHTVEDIKEWILKAKEKEKWIVLAFHRIGEEGEYNWSVEKFRKIVQFIKEEEFEPLTVEKLNQET